MQTQVCCMWSNLPLNSSRQLSWFRNFKFRVSVVCWSFICNCDKNFEKSDETQKMIFKILLLTVVCPASNMLVNIFPGHISKCQCWSADNPKVNYTFSSGVAGNITPCASKKYTASFSIALDGKPFRDDLITYLVSVFLLILSFSSKLWVPDT